MHVFQAIWTALRIIMGIQMEKKYIYLIFKSTQYVGIGIEALITQNVTLLNNNCQQL
jgi:hypothetical protein